jgi:hypothetical protein
LRKRIASLLFLGGFALGLVDKTFLSKLGLFVVESLSPALAANAIGSGLLFFFELGQVALTGEQSSSGWGFLAGVARRRRVKVATAFLAALCPLRPSHATVNG